CGDRDIVLAVVDTGELYTHPDVTGSPNVIKGYNFLSRNLCTDEETQRNADATDTGDECAKKGRNSSSWHGSHVAATIGGVGTNNFKGVAGVNWNVTVVPV